MPLNKDIPARNDLYQDIQYIRRDFTYLDNGKVLRVGKLPKDAVIIKAISGVHVSAVFNAGTSNTLNVGVTTDDDLYGTLLALGALGPVPLDEAVSFLMTADTEITATVVLTGTAATTGVGQIVIAYATKN